ncbi:sulfatase [Salmonella enterica subsp. arizonae serovar 18:z4,z23:- str. CVM N26624]|uniref:Sulfatase n=2 Tax=Salmonella enterica subsp. arizonae serovar 18:z4,z23:- TaxID=1192839 RepID=A0A3S5YHR2_SALER|nr:sulfatase [Salmonella enterica subsp. arizonae serovar 18:z4,z23:- str. CVM N26625]OLV96472.1 sulfatase [Salmonella enterica subsp. arizonae serovar 18:z4,z23:- str. CVM N26626]OLW04415.1 sulfatase [Salmonella enterica subsp. arizonae serovar 18:z4,z23:- str. CVM N26624]OLW06974.1 sulfatase [Salmonella enterica subsp. arizonae serovar 18:z4,z23:- str. CVM N25373]OLW12311.1 sulfatase [Salmonella enterica subsp. arizonae serovar 18:z4,z23:- str. CVM N20028]OLW16148.1 sulfatase [Salmonella ent
MDDLGTGQLDFTLNNLDKNVLSQRSVPMRYQGDLNKMIDAAQRAMPNVAQLAQNGVKMTNAFVAHPVCGPSRAGIYTGRYPTSFGTYSNDDAIKGIPLDIKLLPALFQENGYATANIGKWHNSRIDKKNYIADDVKTRDYHDNMISVSEPGYEPQKRGFDYSYSYYASGAALWNSPAIWRNSQNISAPGYLTHHLTEETLKFIDRAGQKPFFISLAYSVPHIPLEQASPAKYMDRFNTGNVEADKYFAAINAADEGIGKIINYLKEKDELDNTLIFFISDNGAVNESPMPMNGMDRGYKGQMYNGGVHIPFVAYWPKQIPAGTQSDTLISALDILPTALHAAGITIPDEMNVDGKDIMPVLAGKSKTSPHQYLYWAGPGAKHYSEENQPFWYGYWKWITYTNPSAPKNPNLEKLSKASWAIRDQEWALYFYDDGTNTPKLFNDKQDPMESKDLAAQFPERVKVMKTAFYEWIKNKPKPIAWGQDRFHILEESAKK